MAATLRLVGVVLLLLVTVTAFKPADLTAQCWSICIVCHPWSKVEVEQPFAPENRHLLQECQQECLRTSPAHIASVSDCDAIRLV